MRNVIHNLQLLYMESKVDNLSVFSPFLNLIVYYSHCKQSSKWIWFGLLKVTYLGENIFDMFRAHNVYMGCWAKPCKKILSCICLQILEENPIFLEKYYVYNIFKINLKWEFVTDYYLWMKNHFNGLFKLEPVTLALPQKNLWFQRHQFRF